MSAKGFKNQFSVDDVLHSEVDDETKTITHQTGNAFAGETEASSECEDYTCPAGIASIPPPPTGDGEEREAAQFFKKNESDHDAILGHRDLRMNWIYGKLDQGETCVYAGGKDCKAQARSFWKADGSIAHTTAEGNAVGGSTFGVFITTGGSIDSVGKDCASLIRPNDISIFTPDTSVSLNSGKAVVYASSKINLDSGSIILGGEGAKPTANQQTISDLVSVLKTALEALGAKADAAPGPPAGAAAAKAAGAALDAIVLAMSQNKTSSE